MNKLVNKYKFYDIEERAYESIGNIININYESFNIYLLEKINIPRYNYFFSSSTLNLVMDDFEDFDLSYIFEKNNFNLI